MILFSEKNLEYNTITYIEEKNIYIYVCVMNTNIYMYKKYICQEKYISTATKD